MREKIIGKVTGVMLIGIGVVTFPLGIIFIIAGLIGLKKGESMKKFLCKILIALGVLLIPAYGSGLILILVGINILRECD